MGDDVGDINNICIYYLFKINKGKYIMKYYGIFFVISAILWSIEMLPQFIKTIKCKRVQDISFPMYFIATISFLFFFTGCALQKNWILLMAHLLPFSCVIFMLILILKYRRG